MQERFENIKNGAWTKINNGISNDISKPDFWQDNRIELNIEGWTITLDCYTSENKTYTRIRTPYLNNKDFVFKIFRKGFFANVIKLFAMQDIEIGDSKFDEEFIIQGNEVNKVKKLFSSPGLRSLMLKEGLIFVQIKNDEGYFKDKYPGGVDEIYFEIQEKISDIESLESIYNIFSEIIIKLDEINGV